MSLPDVDPGGNRMTEDLTQYATAQVPQVLRPRPLGVEPSGQLSVDRLDQPVQSTQYPRALRLRITFLVLVRCQQVDAAPGQLLPQRRRPVVAVADAHAAAGRRQLPDDFGLGGVGRGKRGGHDDTVPACAEMQAEGIE